MSDELLEEKINSLLEDLKLRIEMQPAAGYDTCKLESGIDKLIYECMYLKIRLAS